MKSLIARWARSQSKTSDRWKSRKEKTTKRSSRPDRSWEMRRLCGYFWFSKSLSERRGTGRVTGRVAFLAVTSIYFISDPSIPRWGLETIYLYIIEGTSRTQRAHANVIIRQFDKKKKLIVVRN